jgi:hypothetical protein
VPGRCRGIHFTISLDNGRAPRGYINQRLQIQVRAPDDERCAAETCSAFNKLWNNKFYYKAASCWYFYWILIISSSVLLRKRNVLVFLRKRKVSVLLRKRNVSVFLRKRNISVLLRKRNVSDKSCEEYQSTHFVFNSFFPRNLCRFWVNSGTERTASLRSLCKNGYGNPLRCFIVRILLARFSTWGRPFHPFAIHLSSICQPFGDILPEMLMLQINKQINKYLKK